MFTNKCKKQRRHLSRLPTVMFRGTPCILQKTNQKWDFCAISWCLIKLLQTRSHSQDKLCECSKNHFWIVAILSPIIQILFYSRNNFYKTFKLKWIISMRILKIEFVLLLKKYALYKRLMGLKWILNYFSTILHSQINYNV